MALLSADPSDILPTHAPHLDQYCWQTNFSTERRFELKAVPDVVSRKHFQARPVSSLATNALMFRPSSVTSQTKRTENDAEDSSAPRAYEQSIHRNANTSAQPTNINDISPRTIPPQHAFVRQPERLPPLPKALGLPSPDSFLVYQPRNDPQVVSRPSLPTTPYETYEPISPPLTTGTQPESAANKGTRRPRAHVQSACAHCKRAHLSCDDPRPCTRCCNTGKKDSCYDIEHKKRGRPRLRDGGDSDRPARRQRVDVDTTISAQEPQFRVNRPIERRASNETGARQSWWHGTSDNPQPNIVHENFATPIAFLDLDMNLLQMNQAFISVLGRGPSSQRRNLEDWIDYSDRPLLHQIAQEIRQERAARDPNRLPPIQLTPGADNLPPIDSSDIAHLVEASTERSQVFLFHLANNVHKRLNISIRLGRSSIFFIVVQFPPMARNPAPAWYVHGGKPENNPEVYGMQYASANHSPYRSSIGSASSQSSFYNFPAPSSSMAGVAPSMIAPRRGSVDYFYSMSPHEQPHQFYHPLPPLPPREHQQASASHPPPQPHSFNFTGPPPVSRPSLRLPPMRHTGHVGETFFQADGVSESSPKKRPAPTVLEGRTPPTSEEGARKRQRLDIKEDLLH